MNTLKSNRVQLFTLSKEESNCPLIPQMLQFANDIHHLLGRSKEESVIITMTYGKRMISTTSNVPLNHLSRTDFIEIVDFDPIRNILLIIGPANPDSITPLQWMIHHGKQEILITIFIKEKTTDKETPKKIITSLDEGNTILETAKNVLKTLQKKSIILIKDKGVLITGDSTESVKERICLYMGKNNENKR